MDSESENRGITMKHNFSREGFLSVVFNILCAILFVILVYYSLTLTGYSTLDLSDEHIFIQTDNFLKNILILAILWGISVTAYLMLQKKHFKVNLDLAAAVAAVGMMMLSLIWVYFTNVAPEADQWNASFYADCFNDGDFSGFTKGKYIATCPHQLGFITVLRLIYMVLGANRYVGFQLLSVLCVGIIVLAGYWLVKQITHHSAGAEVIYLLLILFCFPLYAYTPFIYGEIPSTALLLVGACCLLKGLRQYRWHWIVLLAVCSGLAVQLRQNSLVVLLGFMVVLFVKLIQKPDWKGIILLLSVIAGIGAGNLAIEMLYGQYFTEDAQAIPSSLYIAMGTNWDEENPGWFNGYNYTIFFENDCDPEAADAAAKADIKAFIKVCMDDPAYAVKFYKYKMLGQWNDPMYHCLAMNKNIVEEQPAIIDSIYFGALRGVVEAFMNIYQLIIYAGILLLLILYRKEWKQIENYVLLIGIFGGFLFTMLWEAKSRYVFPYFILMIPYAAIGIEKTLSKHSGVIMRFRKK